jgi:hypothetical protein
MLPSHEFPAALFFLATYTTVDPDTRPSENGTLQMWHMMILLNNGSMVKNIKVFKI